MSAFLILRKYIYESAFTRGTMLFKEYRESRRLKKLIIDKPQVGVAEAFDLYGNQVKTICRNIMRGYPSEDIEDAISQSFIALWMGIEKYSPDRGVSIKSYLYGIARKTCLMMLRNMPRRNDLPIDENIAWTTTTEDIFLTREQEKILHKVLAETDEPARSIFIMRYFYFEKIADIASKLGLPKKKVENILSREKKKLKARLIKEGIEK